MEDVARAIVPALAALMLIIAWLRHTRTTVRTGILAEIPGLSCRQTAIPTIGSTGLISSYRSAIHFLLHARDVIQEGYEKYPNQVFRVPNLIRWEYIVNGTKLGTEVSTAPEDVLSFHHGVGDVSLAPPRSSAI
jgi:hypothetical protein